MEPSVNNLLSFLTYLFKKENLGFSSINTARSAVSALVSRDQEIGKHWLICKFVRGVFNLRPALPRRIIWDTGKVLKFFEQWHPAKNLSLYQKTSP